MTTIRQRFRSTLIHDFPTCLCVLIAASAIVIQYLNQPGRLSERSLALISGRTDMSQTASGQMGCAYATFNRNTTIDCTGVAAQTPCGACQGPSNRLTRYNNSAGGPGIMPSGGILACGTNMQFVGFCDGNGTCVGAQNGSRCTNGQQLRAYVLQTTLQP